MREAELTKGNIRDQGSKTVAQQRNGNGGEVRDSRLRRQVAGYKL